MDAKGSFSFCVIYFGGERQHMSYMYRQQKLSPRILTLREILKAYK